MELPFHAASLACLTADIEKSPRTICCIILESLPLFSRSKCQYSVIQCRLVHRLCQYYDRKLHTFNRSKCSTMKSASGTRLSVAAVKTGEIHPVTLRIAFETEIQRVTPDGSLFCVLRNHLCRRARVCSMQHLLAQSILFAQVYCKGWAFSQIFVPCASSSHQRKQALPIRSKLCAELLNLHHHLCMHSQLSQLL